MRYRLRTLLIAFALAPALGPPVLAGVYLAPQKINERYRQWELNRLIHLIKTTIRVESRWERWDDDGKPVSPVEPTSQ